MPGNQTFNAATPLLSSQLLVAADGTAAKPLIGPEAGRYRIDHILVSNSEPVAHVLSVGVWDGSTLFKLVHSTIPASAGYGSVDLVDLAQLAPVSGQDIFQFSASVELRWQVEVAMGASQALLVVVIGALT